MKSSKRFIVLTVIGALPFVSFSACHRRGADDETPDTSTYRPEATPATQFERDLMVEMTARIDAEIAVAREQLARLEQQAPQTPADPAG